MVLDVETVAKLVGVLAAAGTGVTLIAKWLIGLGESKAEKRAEQARLAELEEKAKKAALAEAEQFVARDQTRQAVARIDGAAAALVAGQERQEQHLHRQDTQLAVIEEQGKAVVGRLEKLEARVDDHGNRITSLEAKA